MPSILFSFVGFKADERDVIGSSGDSSKPKCRKSHRRKKRRVTDTVMRSMKVRVDPNVT